MPIDLVFDPTHERLHTTALGLITLRELLDHVEDEARKDHLGVKELFDAREATTDLTSLQIGELVDRMRHHASVGRLGPTALVTTNDVVYGMARMYSILSQDYDPGFAVFRDIASAEQWLESEAGG